MCHFCEVAANATEVFADGVRTAWINQHTFACDPILSELIAEANAVAFVAYVQHQIDSNVLDVN